jgi:hypothetical protein
MSHLLQICTSDWHLTNVKLFHSFGLCLTECSHNTSRGGGNKIVKILCDMEDPKNTSLGHRYCRLIAGKCFIQRENNLLTKKRKKG